MEASSYYGLVSFYWSLGNVRNLKGKKIFCEVETSIKIISLIFTYLI
jgi:hypothetical protein